MENWYNKMREANMNVIYYLDFSDVDYLKMLEISVKSFKKFHPEGLTTLIHSKEVRRDISENLRGYLDRLELYNPTPDVYYTKNKCGGYHYYGTPGKTLYIDVDTVFLENVEHVFDDMKMGQSRDVAATRRKTVYYDETPYNSGVCFCRSPVFWFDLQLSMIHRNGRIFEQGFCDKVQRLTSWLELSPAYNWEPDSPYEGVVNKGIKILHYKGSRKKWMIEQWGAKYL